MGGKKNKMEAAELLLAIQKRDNELHESMGELKAGLKTVITATAKNNRDIQVINQKLENGIKASLKTVIHDVAQINRNCVIRHYNKTIDPETRKGRRVPSMVEKGSYIIIALVFVKYLYAPGDFMEIFGQMKFAADWIINIAGGTAGLIALITAFQKSRRK